MTTQSNGAIASAHARRDAFLSDLKTLLAIPSISTLPERAADVRRAAAWLAERLEAIGMDQVACMETAGLPVVYGKWTGAPGKPTVLLYGHYDVQPADPLDEWDSPPFEATMQGDNLHARGASDMKGQMVAVLEAVDALMRHDAVGVNLKFLLEGEEEIGSPSLGPFIDDHKDLLACDVVLNCDGGILAPDQPSIVYALRGLAYFEIEVRGPAGDLHSGLFGGVVHNPAHVLAGLIAGMHDAHGQVTLPGFYEAVRPLDADERASLGCLPCSDEDYRAMSGAPALWGEQGFTATERVGARPSLDVNGMWSGFTGMGAKTVLPAKATAKVSMRLVPDQDPATVHKQLVAYMQRSAPDTVTWQVRAMAGARPAVMDRQSEWIEAAGKALEQSFGKPTLFKREGGTVPVVGMMQEKLGVDSVMLGFALPDDGIHGPNEKQHLPTLFRGIETYIRFLSQA